MDWIIGLQKAIDYIEDNLTETIDYEIVAAQAFHQAITSNVRLVFFAVSPSASISGIAGCRLPVQSWPRVMQRLLTLR